MTQEKLEGNQWQIGEDIARCNKQKIKVTYVYLEGSSVLAPMKPNKVLHLRKISERRQCYVLMEEGSTGSKRLTHHLGGRPFSWRNLKKIWRNHSSWWFSTTSPTIPLRHSPVVVFIHHFGGHKPPVCLPPPQILMWWYTSTTMVDVFHQCFYSVA